MVEQYCNNIVSRMNNLVGNIVHGMQQDIVNEEQHNIVDEEQHNIERLKLK